MRRAVVRDRQRPSLDRHEIGRALLGERAAAEVDEFDAFEEERTVACDETHITAAALVLAREALALHSCQRSNLRRGHAEDDASDAIFDVACQFAVRIREDN